MTTDISNKLPDAPGWWWWKEDEQTQDDDAICFYLVDGGRLGLMVTGEGGGPVKLFGGIWLGPVLPHDALDKLADSVDEKFAGFFQNLCMTPLKKEFLDYIRNWRPKGGTK
jgi:hypothetical protein